MIFLQQATSSIDCYDFIKRGKGWGCPANARQHDTYMLPGGAPLKCRPPSFIAKTVLVPLQRAIALKRTYRNAGTK